MINTNDFYHYQHRLIFVEELQASRADITLRTIFGNTWADWQGVSDTSEEEPSFTLSFRTRRKLDATDQDLVLSNTHTFVTYSLNEALDPELYIEGQVEREILE